MDGYGIRQAPMRIRERHGLFQAYYRFFPTPPEELQRWAAKGADY
jgi:hypothetical protein